MRLPIHVAAVQYATEDGNNTGNTDRALHMLDDAAHTSDLILLPEASFTHYLSAGELQSHAQTARGPLTAIVSQIAVTRNSCVCFCIPERDGDRIYNTALLVCADGGIIGGHRKIRLNQFEQDAGFTPGNSLDVSGTYLGRIGILISDDAFDANNAVELAGKGAQIILIPSVALAEAPDAIEGAQRMWEDALRQCAVRSRCHVIWANKIGADRGLPAVGSSMIIAPDGRIMARADMMEEVVRAQVTLLGLSRAA